jgi:hypothetical protein
VRSTDIVFSIPVARVRGRERETRAAVDVSIER